MCLPYTVLGACNFYLLTEGGNMDIISAVLLSISLSMDSLSIGISYALRKIKTPLSAKIIICLTSMIITTLSILFGKFLIIIIPSNISKLIGSLMLCILGVYIIIQAFAKEKKKTKSFKKSAFSFALKPFGISVNIVRDPCICDLDNSEHIDPFEAIYLGIALSVDSFAAGISSAVAGFNSFLIPISVGLFQIIFLSLGDVLGTKISSIKKINSKVFIIISGLILIILSIARYFL